MGKDVSRILAIAEPIAAERGLEVLDVEISGSGRASVIRVLLDGTDDSRVVQLEDCEVVSRRLGDGLDAYEVLAGRYMLEVSSPGLNRPLKRPGHFWRVVGQKVRVRLLPEGGERRTVVGRLEEADDAGLVVTGHTGVTERIAFDRIDKANLEYEFEQKPGRPARR